MGGAAIGAAAKKEEVNFVKDVPHYTFDFEIGNPLPGLGVGTTTYKDPAEQPAIVARLVDGLLRKGFAHNEIVVLTMRGRKSSVFSERERVGNFTLRRFTGDYDLFGNQILTPGQITFDSVRRFKGQQAPAVILVDTEPGPSRPELSHRLLYTGMTRATMRAELLDRSV
jgi:superfamily I DNA/RNA helicase